MAQAGSLEESEHGGGRYGRGLAKLREVDGAAGEEVVDSLGDLGRYVVEFAFGDVYSRGVLSLREREISTVAMLASMGGCEPQLRVHLHAALNVGVSPGELEETIIHTVPYAGFPRAINGMKALKEVLEELSVEAPQ